MGDLFSWTDGLSVGLQELDEQHKLLIDLLNRLHAAVDAQQGSEACGRILDRFVDSARIHFQVEESLMRLLGYPEFEHHKMHHQQLIDQVVTLQARMSQGGICMSFELLHFLKVWLARHICESDRRFGEYALERGLAPAWSPEVEQVMRQNAWSWRFW